MLSNLILGGLIALLTMGLQPNRLLAEANGGALKILAIPKQAKPGERVTVTVQTIPHARCKIEAQGTPVTEALTLLQPMDADHLGNAKWTFEISKNYRADKLPIIVTSSKGSNVVDEKVVTTISISSNASPEQVELKLESKPKRATPGQYVTVSVAATPGAKLKIEAQDAGITQVMALADKTADKTGKASWTFRISETYKADKVPVIITEKWKDGDKKIISTIPIDRRM